MSWRDKSYTELPALSLRRNTLRTALKTVTAAWAFGIVWQTCCSGSRVTLFARALGFQDWHFGLLAAAPFLATLGQPLAALLIERTGLTKFQFLTLGVIHRLLWIAVAGIPVLAMATGAPLPGTWAVWTALAVLTVGMFLAAMASTAWLTWMGDVIPRRIRGRYMANRLRITRALNIPVVIGLAVLLDRITRFDPRTGRPLPMTVSDQPLLFWTICLVFVVGAVMGVIDILLFRRIREVLPPRPPGPDEPAIRLDHIAERPSRIVRAIGYAGSAAWQMVLEPLTDRIFRRYVAFGFVAAFAATVGAQYMWLFMLESLRFSQTATDGLFLVLGPVVAILASPVWGKVLDRWGRRPVMVIGACLTVGSVSPYFFASPHLPQPQGFIDAVNSLWAPLAGYFGSAGQPLLTAQMPVAAWLVMCISMFLGGIGWNGIMLAQNNIILGFADGSGRSRYIAAHGLLVSLGGLSGGLIGAGVVHVFGWMKESPIRLGALEWDNWHMTFFLALAARMTAVILALTMPDPGSMRIRAMARVMAGSIYNNVSSRLFFVVRIFGWGRRNDPGDK